jgi:anthranilate phosphoribosyltransferase
MDLQAALRAVIDGRDLEPSAMAAAMRAIMRGEATPAQIGGLLVALRMKGETVAEIAAAARVMREFATPVGVGFDPVAGHLVDTCGTGGDGIGTFNISTTAAFVVAAAGGRVAKHGNRSVSSRCGSADVLEILGARIDLPAAAIARGIETIGVGFMFAPAHHAATRHVLGPRRELGVRTLFNLLGPLTNPAGAPHQVIGVFDRRWVEPLAYVLLDLGSRHVLVVHADDGLDEISIGAPTTIAELVDGAVRCYEVTPEALGVARGEVAALAVADGAQSATLLRAVLDGTRGPARDIVCLNAGAAIYAGGCAATLIDGVRRAAEVIDSGAARARLGEFVAYTQAAGGGNPA